MGKINSESSVLLLELDIDSKLNFVKHVFKLCNNSAGQLNAVNRFNRYLGFEKKKLLINSFIYSNFNYCLLVWRVCSKNSLNKIENVEKRALRFLLNDYECDYKTLLKKGDKYTMELRRLRTLALKPFKTLNDLNSTSMKNLSKSRKNNLKLPKRNTVKYRYNSTRRPGPHIWNDLLEEIKKENSFDKFKEFLNTWYGPNVPDFLHWNKYVYRN